MLNCGHASWWRWRGMFPAIPHASLSRCISGHHVWQRVCSYNWLHCLQTNSQRKRDLTPCSPVWCGCIWQGRRVSIKVLRVSRAYGHDRTLKLNLASVISVTAGRRILFIPPLTFRGKRATVSQILQLRREQSHKLSHLTTTKEPTNEPVAKIWRQISTYHQK